MNQPPETNMPSDEQVVRTLLKQLSGGKISPAITLPVIVGLVERLGGEAVHSVDALVKLLAEESDNASVQALVDHLREVQVIKATEFHRGVASEEDSEFYIGDLASGLAPAWSDPNSVTTRIKPLFQLLADWVFIRKFRDRCPQISSRVKARAQEELTAIRGKLAPHGDLFAADLLDGMDSAGVELGERLGRDRAAEQEAGDAFLADTTQALPEKMDEQRVVRELLARFQAEESREERERLLDLACAWPSCWIRETLLNMCTEEWAQNRARLLLTLRFGSEGGTLENWGQWKFWIDVQWLQFDRLREELGRQSRAHPLEALAISYFEDPEMGPMIDAVGNSAISVTPEGFVDRWAKELTRDEWNSITGYKKPTPPPMPLAVPVQPVPDPPAVAATMETGAASPRDYSHEIFKEKPKPKPKPKSPTIWEQHLRLFFVENWYFVAGIMMVILGSSLLAYYTWDKHWMWRYTIMPGLLALFTAGFAGAARWIDSRGEEFRGTAATLMGTAIALLPVNFMAMALVANDDQVTQKVLVLSAMALIYLTLAGWGLYRWCSAAHAKLGWPLGGTLLLLNFLAALAPLAKSVVGVDEQSLLLVLGVGFHLGFFVMSAVVVYFGSHVLTAEMAKENRVPWFFGITLGITFFQVFAWVHGYLNYLPQVSTYAPMMILAGGLVLYIERRALALLDNQTDHRVESFFGYAFILLGLLMGASHEYVRVLSFTLASAVWIYQTSPRRQAMHYWIGLTLLVLAGASVGLLEGFPKEWLAAIGVSIGIGMSGVDLLTRKRNPQLAEACRGIQLSVFLLTVVVAVLTQWHFRTDPWATGVCLLAMVGFFSWIAIKNDELRWMDAAMMTLAIALPYLGFVDMKGQTLHGNSMVFALACVSAIWLVIAWRLPRVRVIVESRSTVIWIYGALAVVGMLLRVFAERGAPVGVSGLRDFMDQAGPFLMATSLVTVAYLSRSLVPALMASVIAVILFPELQATLQPYMPAGFWGSGLGSSFSALAMVATAMILKGHPRLQQLEGGDQFLGKHEFPLRRTDYSIFTIPLVFSSLFLLVKLVWLVATQTVAGAENILLNSGLAMLVSSISWLMLATYLRERPEAKAGVHFSWIMLLAGFSILHLNLVDAPDRHWTWPVLFTLLTLQAYFLACHGLKKKWEWIGKTLATPIAQVIQVAALGLGLGFCVTTNLESPRGAWWILFALVSLQLAWRSLQTKQQRYSAILVLLAFFGINTWLTAGGDGLLIERMSRAGNLMPNLYVVLGIHLAYLILERIARERYEKIRPLCHPFLIFACAMALALGIYEAAWQWNASPGIFQWLSSAWVLLAVALTARAQCSCAVALVGAMLAYLLLHSGSANLPAERLEIMLSPWRLATWGLALVLLTVAGQFLARRKKRLLAGPFSQTHLRSPDANWLYRPAIVVASLATLAHSLVPWLREAGVQLWTPYLAAAAAVITASLWKDASKLGSRILAVAFFVLGNIHSVRIVLGDELLSRGLSELHLICLGISVSLLTLWLLRIPFRKREIVSLFNEVSLVLAGMMLVLLSANYFAHPKLAEVTSLRFLVSGVIALMAGIFFRRAARRPGPGEDAYVGVCEAFYHFGVVMAFWCAALIVPWMRNPEAALAALAVPAFYFFAKAEFGWRRQSDAAVRYRNTATVLSFLLLALYAFRGVLHLVMFPEVAVEVIHYHTNAPLVVLLALVLFRLHGIGGTEWLAFYGGLALMASGYFLLTWLPGLSPFTYPVAGAWCAAALGHFWVVASFERSPLRTAIQRLAGIDGAHWFSLRRSWGYCLLALVHVAVLWGLTDFEAQPRSVALLIAAAASITLHQGIVRKSQTYFWVAFIELFVAFHAGFIVDSYLAKDAVIWALLTLWVVQWLTFEVLARRSGTGSAQLKSFGIVMMISVLAHILYHHPSSTTGLVAMGIAAVLIGLGRRETRSPQTPEEWVGAVALPWIPVWLVYFSQTRFLELENEAAADLWPVMCAVGAALAIAFLGRVFQTQQGERYKLAVRPTARLFDHALWWFAVSGRTIAQMVMRASIAGLGIIVALHYASSLAYQPKELMLGITLWLAVGAGWLLEMRKSETMEPSVLLQGCLLGAYLMIRQQLMLTTDFWTSEYDVWMSLAVSLTLAGTKDLMAVHPRRVCMPFLVTLCVMPAVALGLVFVNGLGPDIALVVVGLHSLIFAYLGRGAKDSPYNAVATLGFVAFVLLTFWTKLELHTLNAYVIPVGLGILVLVQLFREHMSKETQNMVRTISLVVMLSSAAYYSILDPAYPVAFHLTMLLLCLGMMGLGGWLKVRIYLYLGFAGLMVDLCALGYKELVGMDRGIRMTIIGAMVLLIGVSLVGGAVYFKTHRDAISEKLKKWRSGTDTWS